jgi:DNA polymerase-3 subunit beta
LPSEDFPVFDQEEASSPINITSKNLKRLITKTSFAMGNQDWRHYLNGLYLSVEDTYITSVATDAHRLATASLSLNESVSESISGIVPRKAINEIAKLVSEEGDNIILSLGSNSIKVVSGGTTFISKLIEGKFPDYEQVIPSGESSTLKIGRKLFSESLSRVSVLSSEKYRGVRIVTKSDEINLSANNPDKEQAEESLVCNYAGESIDIAFNVNYLQEILSNVDDDEIEVHFFGSDKSCLLTCPNSETYKYVVMPLLI